jgi:hypothetical protein
MLKVVGFWVCYAVFWAVSGQMPHPKASPPATVVQTVGFTQIKVVYSRPSAKGRSVFGGLVPYGRIWRVGANESTKFTIDQDVKLAGHDLKKGTYVLYAFPEEKEWEIVVHANLTHWGDGRDNYSPDEDVFRFTVTPQVVSDYQETFEISFDHLTHDSAFMVWRWAYSKIKIPVEVATRKQMLTVIESNLSAKPTAQSYYEAARYFQEQQIQLERALVYVNKALEIGGGTYYYYRVKSLILADLNDFKSAVISAEISMQLADEQGKDEFVKMNKANIEVWKTKW